MDNSKCRFCGAKLQHTVVDLGMSPLCETLIDEASIDSAEPFYPLHAKVCACCFLVQVGDYVPPDEIYSEYPYFSSYSDSWVEHARRYVEDVSGRFKIESGSFVVELASNDGYLLQHFLPLRVRVLGVEPAENVAACAREKGIPTEAVFFGRETAKEVRSVHGAADLIVGNNVLAHVPDINDFVAGMKILLADDGLITMEFPHLLKLIEQNQFDTIYHEHFSYLSLTTVRRIFDAHGLGVFDVEELKSHGGSLRIFAADKDGRGVQGGPRVEALLSVEEEAGLLQVETYGSFESQVNRTKHELLAFLIEAKRQGKSVAGYGAPGKGNTLLNFCGIREDFLDYTVDRNERKHGKYTPGTRIPIFPPDKIRETRPDYLLILPWNLKREIVAQTAYIRDWGGKWVVPIPKLEVMT